jgi:hypothetical protein
MEGSCFGACLKDLASLFLRWPGRKDVQNRRLPRMTPTRRTSIGVNGAIERTYRQETSRWVTRGSRLFCTRRVHFSLLKKGARFSSDDPKRLPSSERWAKRASPGFWFLTPLFEQLAEELPKCSGISGSESGLSGARPDLDG